MYTNKFVNYFSAISLAPINTSLRRVLIGYFRRPPTIVVNVTRYFVANVRRYTRTPSTQFRVTIFNVYYYFARHFILDNHHFSSGLHTYTKGT